jgi:hypothetical protein
MLNDFAHDGIPHRGIDLARERARPAAHIRVERDHVSRMRRPVDLEVREEAVLIAAVPNQLDIAIALDEERQTGVRVAARRSFAIGSADLRLPHLVE